MKLIWGASVVIWILLQVSNCHAMDPCDAIALVDIPGEDGSVGLKKGEIKPAVTQYNVYLKTGEAELCSHGGTCEPTHIMIDGQKTEALKLTNCKVVNKPLPVGQYDDDKLYYELALDRSKFSPDELRIIDVDFKFSKLGLCTACTSGPTWFFLNEPNSVCGKIASAALHGNQRAIRILSGEENGPDCDQPDVMMFADNKAAKRIDGECLLVVRKQRVIDGPCPILLEKGGSFQIGIPENLDDPLRQIGYWAMFDYPLRLGFWNQYPGWGAAFGALGHLKRHGGCWSNANAKICAWKLGDRPPRL